MENVRSSRCLIFSAAAIGAVIAVADGNSWAHGGVEEEERPSTEPDATPVRRTGAQASSFEARPSAERNVLPIETDALAAYGARALFGLDVVLGWGRVPFAIQNLPSTGAPSVTYTRSSSVDANVQSLLLGGSLEVLDHVSVGLRLPVTVAAFSPDGSLSRATAAIGNVELAADWAAAVARRLQLVTSLAIALPTSQGNEIPADLDRIPAARVDVMGYDRQSLAVAAASARGYEDNALFAPNRLGLVPKLTLAYDAYPFRAEPYVKVENLFSTGSSPAYVGDVVGGLRIGYWLERHFEIGLRGWCNIPYAGPDDRAAVSLEPALLGRFASVRLSVGVIVPVAGPPSENAFLGVRLGVAGVW